jgi:hypothetical protein
MNTIEKIEALAALEVVKPPHCCDLCQQARIEEAFVDGSKTCDLCLNHFADQLPYDFLVNKEVAGERWNYLFMASA